MPLVRYAFDKKAYRADDLESQIGPTWRKRIFEIILTNCIMQVHPQGLKGLNVRICDRILQTLDAIDNENDFLDLSMTDAQFLKSIFFHENASVSPGQASIFCLIFDSIEEALDPRLALLVDDDEEKIEG